MIKTLITPEEISTLARPCYADEDKALAYIVEAEQNNIKPAIGDDLFIQLKEGGQTFLLEGGIYERNGKRYELNGIKKALAYFVISRLYESSTVELTRQGVVNRRSEFSDNADERDIISVSRETYAIANRYMEEVEKYLGTDVKNTSQRSRIALIGGGSNGSRTCRPSSVSGGASPSSPSANINVVQGLGNSDKDVISQAGITREFNAVREYADEKLAEAKAYTDEKIAKINIGGGDIADGSVTTDKIADGAVTSNKLSNDVKSKVDSVPVLSGKLNSLFWSQATFAITATPSVIYANTDTSVTFKATFTSSSIDAVEIDDIRITSDSGYSTILKQAQGTKTIDYSETLNLSAKGLRTRYAKILVGTNTKNASVTVYAYNKMYYGALTSAPTSDNYTNMTLLTASSTAKSKTLTFTSNANGSAFYLIVPSDVTQPTGCTNESGVDQGFTQLEDITINGITYKRYRLGGASYNQGANFTFKTK